MILSLILLIIPFSIVGFWTKRPLIAFILAAPLAFFLLLISGLLPLFQALKTHGTVDPVFFSESLSRAIVDAIMAMFIVFPLLLIFQFFMRRRRRHTAQPQAVLKSFD